MDLNGNTFDYDPNRGFSLEDVDDWIKSFSQPRPTNYSMYVSRNTADLLSGDPKRIAAAQKRMRIDKIKDYRSKIWLYGNDLARVIIHLNKNYSTPLFVTDKWNIRLHSHSYKGIKSSGEYTDLSLVINMDETYRFSITMKAGDQIFLGTQDDQLLLK
jgi:hypothetical protein